MKYALLFGLVFLVACDNATPTSDQQQRAQQEEI